MNHYFYNARQVCRLEGVASIELWRVKKLHGGPINCLICAAMVRA